MESNGQSSATENNDDNEESPLSSSGLLSNLAVLELLLPRVEQRRQKRQEEESFDNNTKRKSRKRRKSLRHRDWIEEQVVEYIRKSATMQFQSSKHALPLQTRLRKRPRERKLPSSMDDPNSMNATNKSEQSNALSVSSSSSTHINGSFYPILNDTKNHGPEKQVETAFDFTEAEAIQVINLVPTELVDFNLLIDDLPERLSEQQQEECLSLIQQYRVLPSGSIPNSNVVTTSFTTSDAKVLEPDHALNDDTKDIAFQDSNHVAIKIEEDMLQCYLPDDDPPEGDCFGNWTDNEDRKPAAR
jgi:RNA polymerase Rpb4